ncbi:hypothetical protein FJT64_008856 [Amphibalanus amphitrite]|uniref:RNA-directed DNA polymerase n=1 Tax=Amphibalanus amphitrite TaxID=1232801 RepID=A0A6A4VI48_AMPAM|nr:hypothetical protein FJT64_008856 [Amphibalanus amphitrite]
MEDGVNLGAVAAVGGAGGAFDARLIPEFDGAGDVVQWHTRAQMLCELRGASLAAVLPLRLTGGAFAVWSQMPVADRGSADAVRDALFTAFAPDPFTAYEAFVSCRLQHGESADVFLADLRRLAALFGGVPDRMLVCAFVAGLPETTRQLIRAGTRAESLELASVLARARAVLSDEQRRINVITVSGGRYECRGTGPVRVGVCSGVSADVNALVVADRPLGFDLVLGMDAVVALGGVTVKSADESVFGCELTEVAGGAAGEPVAARPARPEYDAELESWLRNGWLQPYDEAVHGPPRGLVPLMAVPQANKVRPVLDMRELNAHVTAYSADADVCAEHLRKWRRHGRRVAVVDLRRAYLQLRLDRRLWPYQTVMLHGRRHCLTRLGFGLNVAPLLMKAVVHAVLSQDSAVERAVSPYVDDLLVDEEVVSAERVVEHFRRFGLECKPPARAEDGARMLGLRVQPVAGELQWSRDCAVVPPPEVVTRRAVFAWCGRLVAHFPVCGWLRPAAAWVKRHVNQLTEGWDDATDDGTLSAQIAYIQERLAGADPARGQWCWTGNRAVVWADASSIAFGVVIETPDGGVMEDASWLRPSGSSAHINMAELDAAVRGLNLAIAWGATEIELRTDSATVHRWLSDALSGRTRLRTRAAGEMLIRRRVSLIRELTEELQLELTVTLVRSAENLADALTRVPKDWVREQSAADGVPAEAAAVGAEDDAAGAGAEGELAASVRAVHERAGHPGIRRTLYFARRDVSCDVPRATVRAVVRGCDICRSIDPAPVRWRHGSLGVKETWQRVAMDVTHYQGRAYLSVIDCGPSRFCVWRQLRRADAVEVAALTARWGVSLRFRAVHQPGGNGVVERCHRSIKVIAARRTCSVAEAVHIYNVTPRDGETTGSAPAAGVYRYAMRDCIRPAAAGESADQEPPAVSDGEQLRVGDQVWMRRRGTRCTDTSRRGVVTSGVSRQVVEVDGVPWHVRDLRPRHESPCRDDGDDAQSDGEAPPIIVDLPSGGDERPADVAADGPPLRRSERERRPPRHWCEC